jgi:hypothetical protein
MPGIIDPPGDLVWSAWTGRLAGATRADWAAEQAARRHATLKLVHHKPQPEEDPPADIQAVFAGSSTTGPSGPSGLVTWERSGRPRLVAHGHWASDPARSARRFPGDPPTLFRGRELARNCVFPPSSFLSTTRDKRSLTAKVALPFDEARHQRKKWLALRSARGLGPVCWLLQIHRVTISMRASRRPLRWSLWLG